jgi:hypothetical protein
MNKYTKMDQLYKEKSIPLIDAIFEAIKSVLPNNTDEENIFAIWALNKCAVKLMASYGFDHERIIIAINNEVKETIYTNNDIEIN